MGHQTLGRAHLGLGQLEAALRAFQRALHLAPWEEEIRKEDLAWVVALLRHREQADAQPEELRRVEGEEGVLVRHRVTAADLLH